MLFAFLVGLAACSPGRDAIPSPQPVLATSEPSPKPVLVSVETPTSYPAVQPSPTAIAPSLIDLPQPLYLLLMRDYGQGGTLWVLMPGVERAAQVATVDEPITRFDFSPYDGRLAYGTAQGRVYVQGAGQPPLLLFDGAQNSPYPVSVSGLRWSPDGARLAFTVGAQKLHFAYQRSRFPAMPTGVWVQSLDGSPPVWLLSNSYLSTPQEPNTALSYYEDPIWSPDGQALAVREGRHQNCGTVWFYPIHPVARKEEAHSSEHCNHTWSTENSGLLLGGRLFSDSAPLEWVSRDGSDRQVLAEGPKQQYRIQKPFDLNFGLAYTALPTGSLEPVLFFGRKAAGELSWTEVVPNPLCGPRQNDLYLANQTEGMLTVLCGNFDLRVVDPAAGVFNRIDLMPFLQPGMQIVTQMQWGP